MMKNYIKKQGEPDVIVLDMTKFTQEDLNRLEEYRMLSFRLRVLERCFFGKFTEAKTEREKKEWQKCLNLLDKLKNDYDGMMFSEFPQLPDSAVKVFY